MSNYYQLRKAVEDAKTALTSAERALDQAYKDCQHDWEEKYTPMHIPGSSYPASGAGSDWRPGGYVSAQDIPKWTRTCRKCGKTETTGRKTETVETVKTVKPSW